MLFNIPADFTLRQHFLRMNKNFDEMFAFTMTISFAVACGGMCAFHIYLILKNSSTVEMEMLQYNNVFDVGKKANWV